MIKLIYENVLKKKTEVNPRNYEGAFTTGGNMTSPRTRQYSTLHPNFVIVRSCHGYLITELESCIIWPIGGLLLIVLFQKRFSRNKACALINNVLLHHLFFLFINKLKQQATILSLVHKYHQVADVLTSVFGVKKKKNLKHYLLIFCFMRKQA